MDSLTPPVVLSIKDNRVMIGGTDVTGSLSRLAFEIADDGAWLAFEGRADVGELDLDFPCTVVRHHLGGGTDDPVDVTADDLAQVVERSVGQDATLGSVGPDLLAFLQNKRAAK